MLLSSLLLCFGFLVANTAAEIWIVTPAPNLSFSDKCPVACRCNDMKKYVLCQNANLTSLPRFLPPDILQLDLRGNHIERITDELESYSQLEMLDLSENWLVALQPHAFSALSRLRVLRLNRNAISSVQPSTFANLSSLAVLYLNDNNLAYVPAGAFSDLGSLLTLDLSHNMLTSSRMTSMSFAGLSQLVTLVLGNNRLRLIPSSALKTLDKLIMLDLSYNIVENLRSTSFHGLKSLQELHLHDNEIDFVSDWALMGLPWLKKLTLYNNYLTYVPIDALKELTRLEVLDMSGNRYDRIHPDSFTALPWLQHLRLNHCPLLKVVESHAFSSGLDGLRTLEIASNAKLNQIATGAFAGLTSLDHVYLHDNQLINLDAALLPWNDLALVDLTRNPWRCDCDLSWMPAMMRAARNTTHALLAMVTCNSPARMYKKVVRDTRASEYVCSYHPTDHRVIAAAVSVAAFLVVVVVVVFVYRARHNIGDRVKRRFRYRVFRDGQLSTVDDEMQRGGEAAQSAEKL